MAPAATPSVSPASALMPSPRPSRCKLAPVSFHHSRSPERGSSVKAMRCTAWAICPMLGSSLSSAFSASLRVEAVMYTASSRAKGSAANNSRAPLAGT